MPNYILNTAMQNQPSGRRRRYLEKEESRPALCLVNWLQSTMKPHLTRVGRMKLHPHMLESQLA